MPAEAGRWVAGRSLALIFNRPPARRPGVVPAEPSRGRRSARGRMAAPARAMAPPARAAVDDYRSSFTHPEPA
jgi:hypothetical protein